MMKALECEKSLICVIINDGHMLELAINGNITENSFYDVFHRKLFSEMLRQSKTGKQIDLATMLDAFPDCIQSRMRH